MFKFTRHISGKQISQILVLILMQSLLPHSVYAQQTPTLIGPATTYTYGTIFGEASPVYAGSTDCGIFTPGASKSLQLGAKGFFPHCFSPRFGLEVSVVVANMDLQFFSHPEVGLFSSDPTTGRVIETPREFQLQYQANEIQLSLTGTIKLAKGIYAGLGPTFGYRIKPTIKQTDHLISNDHTSFANGQPYRTMTEGASYTARPLIIGGAVHIFSILPLGTDLSLLLGTSGRTELTSPVQEFSWPTLTVGGSIGLLFTLRTSNGGSAESITPPHQLSKGKDSVTSTTSAFSPPHATIDIYSMSARDIRQSQVDIHYTEVDRRATILLPKKVLLLSGLLRSGDRTDRKDGQGKLSLDSLLRLDNQFIKSSFVDIIGSRLRSDPTAELQLFVSPTVDSGQWKQATLLRKVLTQNWDLQPNQVRTIFTDTVNNQSDSIVLESIPAAILAPLYHQRVEQDFDTPRLKVSTSYEAEAGLKGWEIALRNQDVEIASYSSNQDGEANSTTLNWQPFYKRNHLDTSFVTALFTITDSADVTSTARSEIPLIVHHAFYRTDRVINLDAGTETRYYIVPNDSANQDKLEAALQNIRNDIQQHVGPELTIWIDNTKSMQISERADSLIKSFANSLHNNRASEIPELSIQESPFPPHLLNGCDIHENESILLITTRDLR